MQQGAPVASALRFYTAAGETVSLSQFYADRSAFLLLSGPSLADVDPFSFQKRGVVTMGVNNSWATVRPNLWTCADPPSNFHDKGWKDPGITKFVPLPLMHSPLAVRHSDGVFARSSFCCWQMPAVYFFPRNAQFNHETYLTEPSVNWGCAGGVTDSLGIESSRSVMLSALRVLCHLGFKRIYLVGCDFRMSNNAQNYSFEQDRVPSSVSGNNRSYAIMNKRLAALRPVLEKSGIEVSNCTQNSELEAFDYVPLTRALDDATEECGGDFVTKGWYDSAVKAPVTLTGRRRHEQEKYEALYDVDNVEACHGYGRSNHGADAADLLLEQFSPASIIDVGCGHNDFCAQMQQRGVDRCVGVDFACPSADLRASAHALPVNDKSFDVVTAFDTLEHLLPDEIEETLHEFKRVATHYCFSIAYSPSRITVRGENLHPTVCNEAWWVRKLRLVGTVEKSGRYLWGTFNDA